MIVAKRRDIMNNMVNEIIDEGRKIGLMINEDKTKIMKICKKQGRKHIRVGRYTFEEVETFKYLGITLANDGSRDAEVKEKVIKANRALHANKRLLRNKSIAKDTKIKIYNTLIKPVVMYAAETMTLTKKDEESMRRAERKIMRTILGPIKITEEKYIRRSNKESRPGPARRCGPPRR